MKIGIDDFTYELDTTPLIETWEHDTNKDLSIQDSLLSTLHR